MPAPTPQSAALAQAREHGLWGRADSPPDWQQTLDGALAGEPILVKDPSDPRDDFFLVPLRPADPTSPRSAWIMLDPVTLKLREAALLNHWKFPAFPTPSESRYIAQNTLCLPDGTRTRFPVAVLKPNQRNLVWRASDASILPYWPLKEWTAPHPITGEPVSIYATQEGEILTSFTNVSPPQITPKRPYVRIALMTLAGVLIAMAAKQAIRHESHPPIITTHDFENDHIENEQLTQTLTETRAALTQSKKEIDIFQKQIEANKHYKIELEQLTQNLTDSHSELTQRKKQIDILQKQIEAIEHYKIESEQLTITLKETREDLAQRKKQIDLLQQQLNELLRSKTSPHGEKSSNEPRGNTSPSPVLPHTKETPKDAKSMPF